MKLLSLVLLLSLSWNTYAQPKEKNRYKAGFQTLVFTDSSRIYKPNTTAKESLHFRPVELDIWYPAQDTKTSPMLFADFLKLYEQRATLYDGKKDYSGLTEEIAEYFTAELGLAGGSGVRLLKVRTNSYKNSNPVKEKHPLIIYMAGFNGMGYENYKLFETLAQNGYIVVSIWSVGRYPGDMTNNKLDMMEQVYDAEAAVKALEKQNKLAVDFDSIGIMGYSWGGMSAAVFSNRNPLVKAMISLDGSETHYFGNDGNDNDLAEIHNSNILEPETQLASFLYLESGDKINDFIPSHEYHYYKKHNSDKYYVRFLNSKHEDFSSIPFILNASRNAVETYQIITNASLLFFNSKLKSQGEFDTYHAPLEASKSLSLKPLELNRTITNTILLKGLVIDKDSGLPLPYVNLSTLKNNLGTVTRQSGEFEFKVPDNPNDTIRISMVGYKAQEFPVAELIGKGKSTIKLKKDNKQLKEVVISAKKIRHKTLGNKTTSKFFSAGLDSNQFGAEIGIKINIRKKPTFVDTFNFHISYNTLESDALFRFNIYNLENGMPKENILNQNITIPIAAKQSGLISVDLKPYNIVLNDDVMVAIEWLKNETEIKKGEGIYFSLGLFNGGTFEKLPSQAKMKKHRNLGVGFNLDVRF